MPYGMAHNSATTTTIITTNSLQLFPTFFLTIRSLHLPLLLPLVICIYVLGFSAGVVWKFFTSQQGGMSEACVALGHFRVNPKMPRAIYDIWKPIWPLNRFRAPYFLSLLPLDFCTARRFRWRNQQASTLYAILRAVTPASISPQSYQPLSYQ